MDIVLYYAPIACSLVPYVTLTEANATFEVRALNMRKGQHKSADYLKINPKHKVPLLVVDGKTLSENVAIQTWIARSFPQARLLPTDPWQELQAISLLSWCSSGIHPYLTRLNSPPGVCDLPAQMRASAGWPRSICLKITRSPTTCFPDANISSTISQQRMRTSSGASDAAYFLISTCPDSRTAWHTSNA